MSARPDPPQLTANELALLARLEGRPLPRGPALAAALGVPAGEALRLIRRLQRQGWLTLAALVRPPPAACACITYLQVDWSRITADRLEDRLRADPSILAADRVLGACDYRLLSTHADHRSAGVWLRALREEPGVARLATRYCARLCDRPRFAAARLAADARCASSGPD